jgi:hypothetical protein
MIRKRSSNQLRGPECHIEQQHQQPHPERCRDRLHEALAAAEERQHHPRPEAQHQRIDADEQQRGWQVEGEQLHAHEAGGHVCEQHERRQQRGRGQVLRTLTPQRDVEAELQKTQNDHERSRVTPAQQRRPLPYTSGLEHRLKLTPAPDTRELYTHAHAARATGHHVR